MPHRSPTAADIGKTVEVRRDGEQWQAGTLLLMSFGRRGQYFTIDMNQSTFEYCRVPYSSLDPIAELSMAADLLAERGAPEAARVLMLWLSMSEADRQKLNTYEAGDSLTVWKLLLNELEPNSVTVR